ncbi:MAG: VUT family protein [Legionellaceae bacterium]|nr:VUT family protein [Legionellaceae bacterium]
MAHVQRFVFSTYSLLAILQSTVLAFLISFSSIIVEVKGLALSISSLFVPLISGLYLIIARNYSHRLQVHYLNIGLLCLYLFPLSVYLLISLPGTSLLRTHNIYQILFNNLPHKFFATTLAYLMSFYVPLLVMKYVEPYWPLLQQSAIRALGGGLCFFVLQSVLLSPELSHSQHSVIPSLGLVILLLLGLSGASRRLPYHNQQQHSVLPDYLANSSLIILLACIACEYRLMRFDEHYLLTASGILFPFALLFFNVFSECYRRKDTAILILFIVSAPLLFDSLSLMLMASSESRYAVLEGWYQLFMPRRMAAETLALLLALLANLAFSNLTQPLLSARLGSVRLYFANTLSNTVLCISNYFLLYGGIFAYDEIWGLVINNWCYKMLLCLLLLPLTCLIIRYLKPHSTALHSLPQA